jgi:proline iminopeptidase
MQDPITGRYPHIEPLRTGWLEVSPLHKIYYEEVGNPKGKPVVFLHGGPGTNIEPKHREYFDPAYYRVILFDQRGCGKSLPHACLEDNTTDALVEDMEKLRLHFGITQWLVYGGSWGSFLALYYAEKYPAQVSALVLRGIFLGREKEQKWLYQEGANQIFPDEWENFVSIIPPEERGNIFEAYRKRINSKDLAVRKQATRAWSLWEGSLLKLIPEPPSQNSFAEEEFALAFAAIENHYFNHHFFLKTDNQILENISRVAQIPGIIVHGRYDVICPMESAWELHKAWPKSRLVIVPDAGHSAGDSSLSRALVSALEHFKKD